METLIRRRVLWRLIWVCTVCLCPTRRTIGLYWLMTKKKEIKKNCCQALKRERSGSVLECLTRDRGVVGSSLTGVTALCPCARHIYPCIVLVHFRKTCPDITEKTVDWYVMNQIKQKIVRTNFITSRLLTKLSGFAHALKRKTVDHGQQTWPSWNVVVSNSNT